MASNGEQPRIADTWTIWETQLVMVYQFTPGSQRALRAAAGWSSREGSDVLETPALLLGLLAEPECRAAIILSRHGINAEAVKRRWDQFTFSGDRDSRLGGQHDPFSPELQDSLQAACRMLTDYPRPLVLATEHLLFGLVAAEHEVSAWLREQGLDSDTLETEIHRLYGHKTGPLPMETAAPQPSSQPDHRNLVAALRVIDAAANRAQEGLRAVEDYARFVLDDRHLTQLCKQMRHDLADALERISTEQRVAARETLLDVGTELTAPSETRRQDTTAVLRANLTRIQEGLRSLEEFGKLTGVEDLRGAPPAPALSALFKQLRYRSYTLQRAIEITRRSLERLDTARLYVLIDGCSSLDEFERLTGSLVDAGVHLLQFRDKRLDDRRLLERARLLRELTRDSSTLFIMNDRADLAALSLADGVHIGQEELSVKDARTIVGPEALIGVSTHSIHQARQAVLDGANYIGVGPVFASGTKQFEQFPGVGLLGQVAAEIRLPAFAIGGITPENLPKVLAAGFTRVAVSGAITADANPAAAAQQMLAALS